MALPPAGAGILRRSCFRHHAVLARGRARNLVGAGTTRTGRSCAAPVTSESGAPGIVRGAPWITQTGQVLSHLFYLRPAGIRGVGLYVVLSRAERLFPQARTSSRVGASACIPRSARSRSHLPRLPRTSGLTRGLGENSECPSTLQLRSQLQETVEVGGPHRDRGRERDRRRGLGGSFAHQSPYRGPHPRGLRRDRPLPRRRAAGPVERRTGRAGRVLRPHAIAVVGASADPDTIAGLLFGNLVDSHFGGVVLPVNKKHPTVQGIAAYPDLASCPVVPDLVVVCVPASAVCWGGRPSRCSRRQSRVCHLSRVRGDRRRRGLRSRPMSFRRPCRAACGSSVRTARGYSAVPPKNGSTRPSAGLSPAGRTSLLSQSGAIGLAVLEAAETRGLGSARSSRWATVRTLPATTCSFTGARPRHRPDPALSGGDPGPAVVHPIADGSAGGSPSWR